MAQILDESAVSIALNIWLQQNNLQDLIVAFQDENDITLKSLIDLEKAGLLEDYLKELNIKKTRKLLLMAKLRKIIGSNENIENDKSQKLVHIRSSQEEEECLDKLQKRNSDISWLLKQTNNSLKNIEKSSTKCQQEINSKFKSLIIEIERKQNALIDTVKVNKRIRSENTTKELNMLQNEEIKIKIAIKTCEQLLIENMNASKRKNKIHSISNDITNKPLPSITNYPEISIIFDDIDVDKLISSLCELRGLETVYSSNKEQKTILIVGYIRRQRLKQIIPSEIIKLVFTFLKYDDLIVASNERKILEEDDYIFDSVVIKNNGVLTVNDWCPYYKKGGKLIIRSLSYFIVEKGGKIQLDGKGYNGGDGIIHASRTGESYNKPSLQQKEKNLGGGGAAKRYEYGGGGGYGTNGSDGSIHKKNGGTQYGDKYISILHLGSGGGGVGFNNNGNGGDGGGALKIQCGVFTNNGQISVNGEWGGWNGGGGGSGGSIVIECNTFNMNSNDKTTCFITACGGRGGGRSGCGGVGRIRIKSLNNISIIKDCVANEQIIPNPFVG